jgi:hypothetical protein
MKLKILQWRMAPFFAVHGVIMPVDKTSHDIKHQVFHRSNSHGLADNRWRGAGRKIA